MLPSELILHPRQFFTPHPLSEFSGECRFLRNYKLAFPENPFGLFWVEPFNYEWKDYGASWIAPVYWFTGETVGFYCREIFGKNKILVSTRQVALWYGMEIFKFYDNKSPVIITEGPKDRISCSRFYPWVISLLGTGLGTERAEVILSVVPRVIFLLDRDNAGMSRAMVLHKQLAEAGVKSEIQYLPSTGDDPGDYMDKKFIESSRFSPIFEGLQSKD